jgi:Protein of unknown function (DUF3768)
MTNIKPSLAQLNDEFRATAILENRPNCRVAFTHGIASLPTKDIDRIMELVRSFTDFNEGNDPNDEHDFGNVTTDWQDVFWKIDYYGLDLEEASVDPQDPSVTIRVLTVMLSEEY